MKGAGIVAVQQEFHPATTFAGPVCSAGCRAAHRPDVDRTGRRSRRGGGFGTQRQKGQGQRRGLSPSAGFGMTFGF